ncbi:hypothetical protein [Kitasatospora sp. NPDC088783]|uniref:hypothetical protein n=1 Tax=Kitasatospora sp. NPDC088783 TaxID=3364077 RepID=UPI0038180157
MTRRSTLQQQARDLQDREDLGYHDALNRVRQHVPAGGAIVVRSSTLIAVESGDDRRCGTCFKTVASERWAVHLPDARAGDGGPFMLCAPCAKAIGAAAARIPAGPAPDPQDRVLATYRPAAGQVVAYLSHDRIHLLCRAHAPHTPDDFLPVTAGELDSWGPGFRCAGGGRDCSVCGLDAMAC